MKRRLRTLMFITPVNTGNGRLNSLAETQLDKYQVVELDSGDFELRSTRDGVKLVCVVPRSNISAIVYYEDSVDMKSINDEPKVDVKSDSDEPKASEEVKPSKHVAHGKGNKS